MLDVLLDLIPLNRRTLAVVLDAILVVAVVLAVL